MCGIAGFLNRDKDDSARQLRETAERMAAAIRHRGPDDSGAWADPHAGVALGHRRLAILDLSEKGHQPMVSADGDWVLVFNGEIYNFEELRDHLRPAGYPFEGDSDTEVMLAAFQTWGVEKSLRRFNGMFAFAAWNRHCSILPPHLS